ncbi:MAG: LysR family transcriptional regulator [Halomonas sp.]|jgi:DNA-binding transcriptional LysR family regulator|uniref:LysR family transcriptional regulator n=1 Tax=Billgrantia tianxiuensis TaxID=2497861 RepID=A0A6I6SK16_9GAMM|nr:MULTISPECIES: LysR family transcriptional regulator [Halomonas]MCE8032418.1 LysR family transcriptional regulator [Halomonas sp. MCCC 1A11057]MDX5432624.1 LysR family transcriptional regulator [Halomonas sp.]QHC49611.1 LysR family transcriptional regulator [Halomonas tianxiuensis]
MPDVNIHSLKALAIFKTLFEAGTASQAARTLGITQSGVSRSLAQLEENLGIQLFLREKNRLVATPEARELYDEILRLMGNIEELRHSVLALKEFGTSRLRIAAIPGLSFGFVPRLVAGLLEYNRNFSVSLDMMSSHEVQLAVESSHADIGFVTLPITSRVLRVEPWFTTEAVCLVPQGHDLAALERIDVQDLRDQHLVISNQPSISTNPLLELASQHRVRIAGKTEANIGTITALVASHVGITVMNPITAQDQLAPRDGVVMRPFSPAMTFSFGLIYRDNWKQAKVLDFLREEGRALLAHYPATVISPAGED